MIYFPPDKHKLEMIKEMSRSPTRYRIISSLITEPKRFSELGRELKIRDGTLLHYLVKLQLAGIIQKNSQVYEVIPEVLLLYQKLAEIVHK